MAGDFIFDYSIFFKAIPSRTGQFLAFFGCDDLFFSCVFYVVLLFMNGMKGEEDAIHFSLLITVSRILLHAKR